MLISVRHVLFIMIMFVGRHITFPGRDSWFSLEGDIIFEVMQRSHLSLLFPGILTSCSFLFLIFQYTSLFQRGEAHSIPSSIQGASALTSTASVDDSLSDMYRSPPRPLPYDADPRCFRSQRDGLVSRREKGASHSHDESEPLRRSDIDSESESLSTGDKWNGSCEEGSKENLIRSSFKLSSAKATETWRLYTSSEDEDVCPTCLEGRRNLIFLCVAKLIYVKYSLAHTSENKCIN